MGTRLGRWAFPAVIVVMACLVVLVPAVVRAAPFAAVVMDARTGEVLQSTNADTRLHPASLTKMMTLYIAFEAIKRGEISLDTMVRVSARAAAERPSKLGLRAGQRIALRYLIRAAAIRSANDAATAIGEAIEGSEAAFARRMNRTAQALGMTRTTFRNMHGLTQDGHLSTARDMTILGRRLLFDHPEYYNIFSRRSADAGVAQVVNTNRRFLDSYPGADGIKTGYTVAAGYNLTASAERGNKRIIVTVFGGTSTAQRNARVSELMDAGFRAAPNRARTVRPPAPDYSVSEDEVLMSDTAAQVAPAGRTIRLSGAVSRSPRPPARPGSPGSAGPILVAQGPSNLDAALTAAQASAADPAAVAAAEAATEAGVAQALAAVTTIPTDGASIAEAPIAEAPVAETAPSAAMLASLSGAPPPPPRPARAAPVAADPPAQTASTDAAAEEPAPATVAAADAVSAGQTEDAIALALAQALGASDVPPDSASASAAASGPAGAVDRAPSVAVARLDAVAGPLAGTPLTLVPSDGETAAPLPRPEPLARDSGIIMVSVRPEAVIPAAPETEVITRLSTSGGPAWTVDLGRFTTRDAAERALLRAALAEIGTLDAAERRVRQTGGAWEARFTGLTAATAALACQRLAARGTACTPDAPGS